MLKIYTERIDPYIQMLYPYYGIPADDNDGMQFEPYCRNVHRYSRIVPIEHANVALFPVDYAYIVKNWKLRRRFETFLNTATQNGLKTIVFYYTDSEEPIPYENIIVFRQSLSRKTKEYNEIAFPSFCEDFMHRYGIGTVELREKRLIPTVGFVGYVPPLTRSVLYTVIRKLNGKEVGVMNVSPVRRLALAKLLENENINTKFIQRDNYFGWWDHPARPPLKQEYVNNIRNSDYTICARGAGNFSTRFYETLSFGRIPIFIDTDCVLPLEEKIDYKSLCVWVKESELKDIGSIVLDFHEKMDYQEFIQKQIMCRRIWERYLSPDGYFSQLQQTVRNLL